MVGTEENHDELQSEENELLEAWIWQHGLDTVHSFSRQPAFWTNPL